MADERLRGLERRWRETGTLEDGYLWALELYRAGGTTDTDTLRDQIHCLIKYGATHPDDLEVHDTLDTVIAQTNPNHYLGEEGLYIYDSGPGRVCVSTTEHHYSGLTPEDIPFLSQDYRTRDYVWIQDCQFPVWTLENFLGRTKNVICVNSKFPSNTNLLQHAGSGGHFYAHNMHLGQIRTGLSQICSNGGYGVLNDVQIDTVENSCFRDLASEGGHCTIRGLHVAHENGNIPHELLPYAALRRGTVHLRGNIIIPEHYFVLDNCGRKDGMVTLHTHTNHLIPLSNPRRIQAIASSIVMNAFGAIVDRDINILCRVYRPTDWEHGTFNLKQINRWPSIKIVESPELFFQTLHYQKFSDKMALLDAYQSK